MKVRKVVGFLLALSFLCGAFLSTGHELFAKAEEIDQADQSFIEFILSDTTYEGELEYEHYPLYDENLEENGRQYIFEIGEVYGYALLVEIQGVDRVFYEVEEMFYNRLSPFAYCEGVPVYITHNLYLEYKNSAFYDLTTNSIVSSDVVEQSAIEGFGYFGGISFTEQTQTVSYASKSTESYTIQFDLPNLSGSVNGATSCANTAGAILIAYYDRFFENLIPNYTAYVSIGSVIRYKTGTEEIFDLVQQLHADMGTDVNHLGTTFEEFQYGMNLYVTRQGYTYVTNNMFTNGSLNMLSYKTAVQNNKPVALFASGYALLNGISESENLDTITSGYSPNTHVMAGCGYKIDTYYDANQSVVATKTYLKVASGTINYGIGYLNINGLGNLDRAISVQIS